MFVNRTCCKHGMRVAVGQELQTEYIENDESGLLLTNLTMTCKHNSPAHLLPRALGLANCSHSAYNDNVSGCCTWLYSMRAVDRYRLSSLVSPEHCTSQHNSIAAQTTAMPRLLATHHQSSLLASPAMRDYALIFGGVMTG